VRGKTIDAARGSWKGILRQLGVEARFLENRHGPCPMCGGRDRYRWDNKGGNGTYICNQCGAGNGLQLLMELHGWNFARAAREVDGVLGCAGADPPNRDIDDAVRIRLMNDLWQGSTPLTSGDRAYRYLASRATLPQRMPPCLRLSERCRAPDGVHRAALLAQVSDGHGEPVNIHRTFLGPNGKADMEHPRALMPGRLPDGAAIRLFPLIGETLGIAEGIETAFAAADRFGVPVWSAINATMMAKWKPPSHVREVLVFGDNDAKFAGQAAAFSLARMLAGRLGLRVQVHIPNGTGRDWADDMQAAGGGRGL
jgi:putative DNA primase/helicase